MTPLYDNANFETSAGQKIIKKKGGGVKKGRIVADKNDRFS